MTDLSPVDAMTTLSPSAQAVKDAALAMYSDCNVRKLAWPLDMPVVAAALRAAAAQVVPRTPEPAGSKPTAAWHRWNARGVLRLNLLAIADELEGNAQ